MKYSIKVNSINSKEESNIKGFATVVFGDSFKITNIAILENKDKDQLFVSMPRYKSNERDESGTTIYKDVCNPITAEFREELYTNILEEHERALAPGQEQVQDSGKGKKSALEMPEFSVTVSPYKRDGSNIKGLARIYIEESFIVNNVNILQGNENIFVSMPAYKTKQIDEQGKPIYQDVCYSVTKEFREKLYAEIVREYEQAKEKSQNQAKNIEEKPVESRVNQQEKEPTPFR
jgi:DNA-binding cell septation regulator SpoVG